MLFSNKNLLIHISYPFTKSSSVLATLEKKVNPLPDMPIFGSSNSAEIKDLMSKIWKNGDIII